MEQNKTTVIIHKAIIIGTFFLLAFIFYGLGRNFFESEILTEKYIGTLLVITNSILVIFIGIFLRHTLIQYNILVGNIYLLSRVFEAVALSSIVLNLIPTISISLDYGYFLAMLVLGIGSIPMCFTLYTYKIAPKWLSIWGMIGYTVFAFGFLMELFGKEWSMYLLALGGLWEVTFAIWLIIKGGKNRNQRSANIGYK
jgi:hypothetical protein